MLKLFDRYVLREVVPPFLIGLLVYTFVLLMNQILLLGEMFIDRGVPLGDVGRALLLLLPSLLAFSVPMAVLMGILAGLSRLSSDAEVTAFKTLGIGFGRMLRPVLVFALGGWILTSALTLVLAPRANHRWVRLYASSILSSVQVRIEPREFNESIPDMVFFIEEIGADREWRNVFVSIRRDPAEPQIILAKRGRFNLHPAEKRATLELFDGDLHAYRADDPAAYKLTSFRRYAEEIDVESLFPTFSAEKRVREKDILELRAGARAAEASLRRLEEGGGAGAAASAAGVSVPDYLRELERARRDLRAHRVEIHKKFALPAACFIFVLVGLPLGVSTRKGGRTSGFTLSIGIILVYYVLITAGEKLAMDGRIAPWLGMWGPNLILTGAGLHLFLRTLRESAALGRPGLLGRLLGRGRRADAGEEATGGGAAGRAGSAGVSGSAERAEAGSRRGRDAADATGMAMSAAQAEAGADQRMFAEAQATPASVSGPGGGSGAPGSAAGAGLFREFAPSGRRALLRFPNILDRYIGRKYLAVFGLLAAALVSISLIVTFFDQIDNVYAHDKPLGMFLVYLAFRIPEFLTYILPVAALTAALLTLGLLAKFNELTAMKACGVSVYRAIVPVLVLAAGVGGAALYLQERALPVANGRAQDLWFRINDYPARSYSYVNRHWVAGRDRQRIYHYDFFDPAAGAFSRMSVYDIDPASWSLRGRSAFEKALLDGARLDLRDGWFRTFEGSQPRGFEVRKTWELGGVEGRDAFLREWKEPARMNMAELRAYAAGVETMGFDARRLRVSLQSKAAFPLVSLVMTLLGVPFAFMMGKRGTLAGLGLAVAIAMVYWGAIAVFRGLGNVGVLTPFLAAWAPNIFFGSAGVALMIRLRT